MTSKANPTDQWILMPVIDCLEMTLAAIEDCLRQEALPAPPRILVIDNGSSKETRRTLELLQVQWKNRLLVWFHHPPLGRPPFGTLSASWNAGLQFCWSCGAREVLVVNNDVRLHPRTYAGLRAVLTTTRSLFVTAVGVTEEEYEATDWDEVWRADNLPGRGGPDFSCFVISRECHSKYRFDESLTYFNDNDYHRRLQLGGEGERIFSVNIPYLHFGSATINRTDAVKEAYQPVFELHRERYIQKWGGLPGKETLPRGENGKEAIGT